MIRLLPFLLLLLLLVAFTTAKDIPGFWSLDCGGEGFEAKNNITWVSDKAFVRSGVISQGRNGTNLRVFPSKKKNCYTVPVGKEVKILVRLTFSYGNYDGLGSPPEMRLIFDGHDSGTFQTTTEGGEFVEVIYVTRRNNTSICFGRTSSNRDPFAHKIEVRILKSSLYSHINKVLRLATRNAYGADGVIQYPDDHYDRMWLPRAEGFTVVRSDSNSYTNLTDWPPDDPPPLITGSAVGPLDLTSSKLSIRLSDLPADSNVRIHLNIYVSEMLKTTSDGRAFNVFIGGTQRTDEPIRPPYRSCEEYYISNIKANNETRFDLVNSDRGVTAVNSLPPIISAIEVYRMEEGTNVTSQNDVEALGIIQERFKILQDWTGDPCLPEYYNWEWVRCELYRTRVSKLSLAGFGLSGELPDFSDLDQLVIIDLHNNSLSGSIPEFFNNFQYLTKLNLANNNFTSIPPSLLYNDKIKLNISGNPIPLPTVTQEMMVKAPELLFCLAMIILVILLVVFTRRSKSRQENRRT